MLATALSLLSALAPAQTEGPVSTGTAALAAPETTEAQERGFVKGEFAHAGTVRVVPNWSFVGVRIGALLQETTLFAQVAPKVDLEFLDKKLRLGVDVPLNLEVYSVQNAADEAEGTSGFRNLGQLRQRDWDEARDFAKVLRYLTYGKKEDNLYLSLGQVFATTLGHGQSMRRYQANVDVDQTRLGLELDAYGDYGGFEFLVADVTRGSLFGVLAFVKPLSFLMDGVTAKSLSLGVHYTSDQRAPWALRRNAPVGSATLGTVITDAFGAPQADTRAVNVVGVDAEVKLLKTAQSDIKTYADFSMLNGAGSGVALGVLGRFNLHAGSTVHLLRTRLELRSYEANFVPSYFDTLYEYQKYQFSLDPAQSGAALTTKLQAIAGRVGQRRLGAYVEATYSLPDWFTLAGAYETETQGQDRHLMLHLEVPAKMLSFFATYHQRNLRKFFTLEANDLIFAGARMQLLPILFLNGRVQKSFAWDPARFAGLGAYDRSLNYQVDAELGFAL
jgi:hypothetical protein